MSNDIYRQQELLLKGVVSELPERDQHKVTQCIEDIDRLVQEYGDLGLIAIALYSCKVLRDAENG